MTLINELLIEYFGSVLDGMGLMSTDWHAKPVSKYPCHRLIDHKRFLLHPRHFQAKNIPIFMAVQKASTLVVTLPGTPHFGFNAGINFATAREFATVDWVKTYIGKDPCPKFP